MPTDRQDLAARLAATTPSDTARGLVFDALFDTVEEHLGHAVAVELDPARKARRAEFLSYPVADLLRIAYDAADRLERRLGSPDEAFRAFGYRTTSNVFGSRVGATMLALAGRSGPRALLGQALSGYRATFSGGERRLEWLGERHARFTFDRELLVPAFHCGVLVASVDAAGARPERVEGRQVGPLAVVCEIAWSDPR